VADWTSFAITITAGDRTHTWVRFAPDAEHAETHARADIIDREYHGAATLDSVTPCADPRKTEEA
jgi:hypothetical protein